MPYCFIGRKVVSHIFLGFKHLLMEPVQFDLTCAFFFQMGGEKPPASLITGHQPICQQNQSIQENYNTPVEHTPGNPPTQLWKESRLMACW